MTYALPALAVCGSSLGGTAAFSAAVVTNQDSFAAVPPAGERGDLAILARQALHLAGCRAGDLRTVVVDRGPGSYIGLRVAVTFARCLAAFAGAELRSVDSLAAVTRRAIAGAVPDAVRRCPVLDGRQGRLQIAAYRWHAASATGAVLHTEQTPHLLAEAELSQFARAGDLLLAAGPLLERVRALLDTVPVRIGAMPALLAADLLRDGLATDAVAPMALEPLYLAGSYVG